MLVLDTETLPVARRIEAFQAVAATESGLCTIEHERPDTRIRLERWNFGPLTMFSTRGSGIRVGRTLRQVRRDSVNTISITTQSHGEAFSVWDGTPRGIDLTSLVMSQKTAGYDYGWSGSGQSLAVMVDADRLALPDHQVRAAIPLIATSAAAPLLLHHVRALHHDADRLSAGPAADALATATLELARAVILSVTAPPRHVEDDPTLLTQILSYARLHLTDPDLTPQRIAQAHHVSVRTLYRLCGEAEVSLEQWIIEHRLEGARRDLASPRHARRTIEAVARSWGFTDPAHFSRRFRQAHGLTPRAWRHQHRTS
ncbi:AraC-like DNA-binding protein [Actinocorallia herbida]|uniref:AraC-like DNA-binding protein n=1 Tax=Actinocorallia herbida TaxID=58109 RepID=A0A3N1CYD5_9ACTN|nr:helix-turn-helix domain-containing protein [Actinocorallia herbida]ROO86275.1 AraC-like DNA-binding protein [Actinocorallia herbida]